MKKITILFVAVIAMMAMTGCNEKKTIETLNGEWSVTTIGEMAVPDSVDAFMGFNLEEKTIYGSTGCNQLTGSLPTEITPEVPLFAAMGCTRMMCADMTTEDAMLPALGSVVDFKLNGNTLLLLNADGQTVMTLEKR